MLLTEAIDVAMASRSALKLARTTDIVRQGSVHGRISFVFRDKISRRAYPELKVLLL